MDLAQLETFLAVVEERGFSRAASRLHRTQPAVSHTIRRLEDEIGEPLFERSSREGTLTASGELLREYAERMLGLRREATSALEQLRSLERGRLHIAANEYTCLYLLPVLDEFRRLCPHVSVLVERAFASRIPDQLLDRSVELGVVTFTPPDAAIEAVSVYTDPVVFVVNPRHPLAREKEVGIRQLGAESFIAHNVVSPLRRRVIALFEQHQTPLNMYVELPSLEAIKRFVAMGNGVALVPGLTVQQELERGELVQVAVPELKIERQLMLARRRHGSLSYAAQAFLKVLESVAAERGAPFCYRSAVS
ncbi:LysR family transcriptional regulator [Silvibacterium dinghuense]|uniref:LysR family transcriptional regulator n=1 Tax=Silvibacterium dinghuense TaxID=1560006 RepID=A0A4Q1SBB6_9BACT|nr:LysR family transcriptional regulator [Silvibacterium dinghuense]RXS94434.1 LysR family transcriptional regulator [Silvibacterium dinghuense]GGH16124.1 transcriptional regulator CynR [Silvibacterium dinghuense]